MTACCNVGDDVMIRSVHNSRGAVSSPLPAFFVFRYIVTEARYSASRWFMCSGSSARSTAATSIVIDQRQAHRFLGGEVAAEGAWRDVGDRSDLLDGRLFEPLLFAKLDGGVDQWHACAASCVHAIPALESPTHQARLDANPPLNGYQGKCR